MTALPRTPAASTRQLDTGRPSSSTVQTPPHTLVAALLDVEDAERVAQQLEERSGWGAPRPRAGGH